MLTDTVGFVSKLPHHLIKAFRSTLEEVAEADLLIHVVDYSNPHYEQLIQITIDTLKDLGVENIPVVYAYNKADLTEIEIPQVKGETVYLSAKKRIGLDELIQVVRTHIFKDYVHCQMLIPYDQGHLISYFNEHATVLNTEYENEGTKLTLDCKQSDVDKYRQYVIEA